MYRVPVPIFIEFLENCTPTSATGAPNNTVNLCNFCISRVNTGWQVRKMASSRRYQADKRFLKLYEQPNLQWGGGETTVDSCVADIRIQINLPNPDPD